jgi:uncharacterized protein YxjI
MAENNERYTIRRKVFKLFGAGFHVYDPQQQVVGYCKQKAFRLKEDLRVYTDESMATELFRITTNQVLDISGTYQVIQPDGAPMGALKRKGLKSTFLRDEWIVFDERGQEVGMIREDSGALAIVRRLHETVAMMLPQKFKLTLGDGRELATFRTHFNPFVYRLGVAIHGEHEVLDDLMILAAGCLLAAIEGRQA